MREKKTEQESGRKREREKDREEIQRMTDKVRKAERGRHKVRE